MFELTKLSILESEYQATIVCVRLIGGGLSQQATFDIFTQPGSAEGKV